MNFNTLLILGIAYMLISKKNKNSAPAVTAAQLPTQEDLMKQAQETIKQAQDAISSI